jgi:ribosome-associated protein
MWVGAGRRFGGNPKEVFHGYTYAPASEVPRFDHLPNIRRPGGGPLTTATLTAPAARLLPTSVERAAICARTARDHKARDIVVLDVKGRHPLFDYFLVCTGTSRRQIHTLAEEIDDAMRAIGDRRQGIEGYQASKWVVQDYGDILVHVFDPDTRAYYSLEELWADAPRVDWERE